jgi:hypothetical protein
MVCDGPAGEPLAEAGAELFALAAFSAAADCGAAPAWLCPESASAILFAETPPV